MQQREFVRAREEARKQRLASSLAAQAVVLGQSSAQTIAQLAERTVDRALGSVQRDINQIKNNMNRKRKEHPVEAATATAAAASSSHFTLHPAFLTTSSNPLNQQGGDRSTKKHRVAHPSEL